MSRISYRRTTPEGWQETIRRMVTLNKAEIEPADAREIVKYLSDNLGLAPEETKPAYFETERRLIDFKYTGQQRHREDLLQLSLDGPRDAAAPHGQGVGPRAGDASRLVSARRWPGLPPRWPAQHEPGPDGRPPDNRHPMDKALAHLKPDVPIQNARMDGVVRNDAERAARWARGC